MDMTPRDELEARMLTTVPPILVAVAIFSLTVMALEQTPKHTFVDEIFGLLGLFSLFSSAWIIDHMLDEIKLKVIERFKLIGGGYFLFCIVIAAMSTGTLLLYYVKKTGLETVSWNNAFLPFLLTGMFIILKLMSHRDRQVWSLCIMLAFGWSIKIAMNI